MKVAEWAVRTASGRELKGRPDSTWNESEVSEYREKHGVPNSAEEYRFKPDNIEAGVHWPENSDVESFLHENHVPKNVAEGLRDRFYEHLKGQTIHALEQFEDKIQGYAQQSEQEFRKEWGREYEGRLDANSNFIRANMTEEQLKDPVIRAALSIPAVVRIIDMARAGTREGTIPGTGREMPSGSMNPGQQAAELMKSQEYRGGDRNTINRVNQLLSQQAQLNTRK